jgi:hypothetical protein
MENIKINGKEIVLNSNVKDITIDNLNKIIALSTNVYQDDVDKIFDIISILYNLTKDEIEDLDYEVYLELTKSINNINDYSDIDVLSFENTFIFNGITYKTNAVDSNYKFKLREVLKLEEVIKQKPDDYISILAGILYVEVDEEGNFIGDSKPSSVNNRANIFQKHMTVNYIMFYLTKLTDYLQKKVWQ